MAGTVTGLVCPDPHRCTGFLPGSDRTALDTDLVLPDAARYPLVVNVHGWGGNKGTGEPGATYPGDRYLTGQGYAVLRYSARGFGRSWGQTELGDPDREIADIRALVSSVVDDPRFAVNPDRIAVIGASYGGHHAWMMAATSPHWTTPGGRAVRLATVVPIMGWTDLVSALLPNGSDTDSSSPVGTPKLSYLTTLNALGVRTDLERPYPNIAPDVIAFFARAAAGEPFQLGGSIDPAAGQLLAFLRHRSAAATGWLDTLRHDRSAWVPVFAVQGWTDDLFPSTQATSMVEELEAVSPDYPVKLYLGDIGHPRSPNRPEEWERVEGLVGEWLAWWLKGAGPAPRFDVTSSPTTLGPFDPRAAVTVPNVTSLSNGMVTSLFTGSFPIVNQPVQISSLLADPLLTVVPGVNSLAGVPTAPGFLGAASLVQPVDELAKGRALWYQGHGRVRFTGTLVGTDVQYDVHVWDRDQTGRMVLVDRGTRKLVGSPGPVEVGIGLAGSSWRFPPGHEIVVDITNSDLPYLRPNNLPSATAIDHVTIDLPTFDPALQPAARSSAPAQSRVLATHRRAPAAGTPAAPQVPAEVGAVSPTAGVGPGAASARGTGDTVRAPSASGRGAGGRPGLAALIAAPFLLAIAVAALRRRRGA